MSNIVKRAKLGRSTLTEDAGNARTHDQRNIEAVKASLRQYGQYRPFVIDEDRKIAVGNGMFRAMAEIAAQDGNDPWTKVECVVMSLTPEEFRRLSIMDNRSAELAEWDMSVLLEDLKAIADDEGDGLDTAVGFDADELAEMLADLEDDGGGAGGGEPPAEVPFSEVMGESNNYVVLMFRNDIDWLAAMEHFGLSTVQAKRQNGKPWSRGIGRVVDGAKYLTDLQEV